MMKKKSLFSRILFSLLTIFFWYTGIKGTVFVLSNPSFHYNGLPLWGVYYILIGYLLLGLWVTIATILKFTVKRD